MRYTRKFVQARFDSLAKALGRNGPNWVTTKAGKNVAQVDTWYLDYAAIYGGYEINKIVNEGGGITVINGQRMTAGEIIAWMDGVWYARELAKRGDLAI